jgi:hypothetical protein
MNLPGLGAYTSYLPSGERAPDPDLGRLREQAQRHAENAPVIEQMLDTERRMSCVKAGLTMDQAQDLVQANWQLERAWELLANHAARPACIKPACMMDAVAFAKSSSQIVARLVPALPQESGIRDAPPPGRASHRRPPLPTEEESRHADQFFSEQLPRHVLARLGGQGVRIEVIGSTAPPPETAASVVPHLCLRGPRAWFDEAKRTLLLSGSVNAWAELRVTTGLLREDAARFKLPVFWYAIGQALEATAMPRGSQDPDLTAERATRDHPYAMSRADAAQEAALILGHELAGVAPVSPRLRRFVQRILDPAEP